MGRVDTPEPKLCARCGRSFAWRKRWARTWDQVRYCSDACRRARLTPTDQALEQAILQLLEARPAGGSICPSEAARAVYAGDDDGWRALMEPARQAARRLVAAGRLGDHPAGACGERLDCEGPHPPAAVPAERAAPVAGGTSRRPHSGQASMQSTRARTQSSSQEVHASQDALELQASTQLSS